MSSREAGFTLFEVVLGVVLLGMAGALAARGGSALARSVEQGRRWSAAALLGATALARIERSYRLGAPSCVVPPAGALVDRGVRVSWAATDLGDGIDLAIELRTGGAGRGVDTVRSRIGCR
ncbi:MAG: type II secretion system protein J [Gemmatimonadales bacterium]